MEIGLEEGFRTALSEFVIMQLQLAAVFFTFMLGIKMHFYGRTLLHGGPKYNKSNKPIQLKRSFVVFHAKFAENYRLYSRSHFIKAFELLILLIIYDAYGSSSTPSAPYVFITFLLWFLVGTWLFAPALFNPSGFEWQKIVDDWEDWSKWVNNRGGIGVPADKSWETWWEAEQEHLERSGFRGRVIEILLAGRFLIYQYGLVYHLNIAHNSHGIGVSYPHS
jgi:callose synthase